MGILETFSRQERLRQELWDRLPDYEALGMTEDDVDLELAEEE